MDFRRTVERVDEGVDEGVDGGVDKTVEEVDVVDDDETLVSAVGVVAEVISIAGIIDTSAVVTVKCVDNVVAEDVGNNESLAKVVGASGVVVNVVVEVEVGVVVVVVVVISVAGVVGIFAVVSVECVVVKMEVVCKVVVTIGECVVAKDSLCDAADAAVVADVVAALETVFVVVKREIEAVMDVLASLEALGEAWRVVALAAIVAAAAVEYTAPLIKEAWDSDDVVADAAHTSAPDTVTEGD